MLIEYIILGINSFFLLKGIKSNEIFCEINFWHDLCKCNISLICHLVINIWFGSRKKAV